MCKVCIYCNRLTNRCNGLACVQIDPFACGQVNGTGNGGCVIKRHLAVLPLGFAGENGGYEQCIAIHKLIVNICYVCIVLIFQNHMTNHRHTRIACDLRHFLQIICELLVQSRVKCRNCLRLFGHIVNVTYVTVGLDHITECGELQCAHKDFRLVFLSRLLILEIEAALGIRNGLQLSAIIVESGACICIAAHIIGHKGDAGNTGVDNGCKLCGEISEGTGLVTCPKVGITLRANTAATGNENKACVTVSLCRLFFHCLVEQ